MNNNLRMVSILTAFSVLLSLPLSSSVWAQASDVEIEFRKEMKMLSSLRVYNQQLQLQSNSQKTSKKKLIQARASSKNLERQLLPLLTKVVNSLDNFVKKDLPFRLEERQTGIQQVRYGMAKAESPLSDQYRQALSLYQIEDGYGRNYESYTGSLDVDGKKLTVDYLRIGRIGFYYQTKDRKKSAMWNKSKSQWVELPSEYNRDIRKAIQVANKSTAPELLSLPLIAPEGF